MVLGSFGSLAVVVDPRLATAPFAIGSVLSRAAPAQQPAGRAGDPHARRRDPAACAPRARPITHSWLEDVVELVLLGVVPRAGSTG